MHGPQQLRRPADSTSHSTGPSAPEALYCQRDPRLSRGAGSSVGERGLRASERAWAHTAPCRYRAKNFLNVSGWKSTGPTGSWKEHSPLGSSNLMVD